MSKRSDTLVRKWRVYGVRGESRFRKFILHLCELFPQGSVLVLDFMAIPDAIAELVKSRGGSLPEGTVLVSQLDEVSCGGSPIIALELTRPHLDLVADSRGWLTHIHVARSREALGKGWSQHLLMEGYDMGAQGFEVSAEIPEEAIKSFCEAIPCLYERLDDAVIEPPVIEPPKTQVWRSRKRLSVSQCIRHLPLLFGADAVLSIPVWIDNGTYVFHEIRDFLRSHGSPAAHVLPVTRMCQDEELAVLSLGPDDEREASEFEDDEEFTRFPDELQMTITPDAMEDLASCIEAEEGGGILYLYAQQARHVLFSADFGGTDMVGVSISRTIDEARVRAFCEAAGCACRLVTRWDSVDTEVVEAASRGQA